MARNDDGDGVRTIRIGSGAGYSGDRIEPALELAEKGDIQYLVFECLGERTVALAQQARMKNPDRGYDPLLEERMRAVPGSDSIAVYGAISLPFHCRNRRRSVSITGPLAAASVTPGLSGAIMGFLLLVSISVCAYRCHCEERKRRSNPAFLSAARWIASRSLSSGAHSRDPVARNDADGLRLWSNNSFMSLR